MSKKKQEIIIEEDDTPTFEEYECDSIMTLDDGWVEMLQSWEKKALEEIEKEQKAKQQEK